MGATVYQAEVAFGANTKPLLAKMNSIGPMLTARLGSIGAAAGTAFSSAFTIGATAGLAALAGGGALALLAGKNAVAAAVSQQEAEAKLGAVLTATGNAAGFTASQLVDMAGELQKVTKFQDDTTISAQAVLATFKEIEGESFKGALEAAMDMATVMGTDLQGSIVLVGKALNDPVRGLSALSRVGVSFSESQENLIKRLQETGDVLGAQKIILNELNSEFGGSARAAANTFAGQWEVMGNRVGEVFETLGFAIIPSLKELQKPLADVVTWLETNIGAVTAWGESFAAITRNVVAHAQAAAGQFAEFFGSKLNALITSATGGSSKSLSEFVTNALGSLEILTTDFGKTWEFFKTAANLAFTEVSLKILTTLNTAKSIVMGVFGGFSAVLRTAFDGGRAALAVFGIDFQSMLAGVTGAVDFFFDHFLERARKMARFMPGISLAIGKQLSDSVPADTAAKVTKAFEGGRKAVAAANTEQIKQSKTLLGELSAKFATGFVSSFAAAQGADDPLGRLIGGLTNKRDDLRGSMGQQMADMLAARAASIPAAPAGSPAAAAGLPKLPSLAGLSGVADFFKGITPGKIGKAIAGVTADAVAAVSKGAVGLAGMMPTRQIPKVEFAGLADFSKKIQSSLTGNSVEKRNAKNGETMAKGIIESVKINKDQLTAMQKVATKIGGLAMGFME